MVSEPAVCSDFIGLRIRELDRIHVDPERF